MVVTMIGVAAIIVSLFLTILMNVFMLSGKVRVCLGPNNDNDWGVAFNVVVVVESVVEC